MFGPRVIIGTYLNGVYQLMLHTKYQGLRWFQTRRFFYVFTIYFHLFHQNIQPAIMKSLSTVICLAYSTKSDYCDIWLANCNEKCKATPILKSQSSKIVPILRKKNVFNQYRFLKEKELTKSNLVLLCFCQRSFCQNDVFNFLRNWSFLSKTDINNRKL